jgi:ATP phosphoribosyltransferase
MSKLILAVPKGRILDEVLPLLREVGIEPEADFFDKETRKLEFATSVKNLNIIRVRSFDVATFVAFGAAHIGIIGNDVMEEFDYSEIYSPVNLGVGKCRLALAEFPELAAKDNPSEWSHVRVATKYPNLTSKFFAARGVQAECVKLNGAMELAPRLGLCRRIVDLVSSGATLKANGLVEVEKLMDISSYFITNRTAFKTRNDEISEWIAKFESVARG